MKHVLLALALVACNHGAAAPENAPPPASPHPAVAAAPAPGCYTPSPVESTTAPATFVGSDEPVDCSPGQPPAAVYCAHVHDACCVPNGWVCNNARYVDWYATQCGR